MDPALVWLRSLPRRNGRQRFVDVHPLPHGLGHGGAVQLGFRGVGVPLPPPLRGVSSDFGEPVTRWLPLPPPAVDVVSSTSWSSHSFASSSVVRRGSSSSTSDTCISLGPGLSALRPDEEGLPRVHERARCAHGLQCKLIPFGIVIFIC